MKFLMLILILTPYLANALESNGVDDSFRVKEVKGQVATLEGKAKSLKAGDDLYFNRSPFKFTIESVSGNTITIKVPANSDLQEGNGLVRHPTAAILKGIDTEKKLKSALED